MLIEIGQKAKETSYILGKMGTDLKNAGLLAAAQEILDEEDEILKANAADVAKAKERGMAPGLVDRLELNHKRIEGIVEGMRQVVGLEDPVGEVISMKLRCLRLWISAGLSGSMICTRVVLACNFCAFSLTSGLRCTG